MPALSMFLTNYQGCAPSPPFSNRPTAITETKIRLLPGIIAGMLTMEGMCPEALALIEPTVRVRCGEVIVADTIQAVDLHGSGWIIRKSITPLLGLAFRPPSSILKTP
jgi:hypothetical protein